MILQKSIEFGWRADETSLHSKRESWTLLVRTLPSLAHLPLGIPKVCLSVCVSLCHSTLTHSLSHSLCECIISPRMQDSSLSAHLESNYQTLMVLPRWIATLAAPPPLFLLPQRRTSSQVSNQNWSTAGQIGCGGKKSRGFTKSQI